MVAPQQQEICFPTGNNITHFTVINPQMLSMLPVMLPSFTIFYRHEPAFLVMNYPLLIDPYQP